jgi:hypothetical protein
MDFLKVGCLCMFSGRIKIILSAALIFLLSGCDFPPPPPSTISFYDQCGSQHSSFVAMAQCGKANRNAWCQANNACSDNGNAIVVYADSLVVSVKNHELTEAEAQRRWIEFRMAQVNAAQQQAAIWQSMRAPITCFNDGFFMNCY